MQCIWGTVLGISVNAQRRGTKKCFQRRLFWVGANVSPGVLGAGSIAGSYLCWPGDFKHVALVFPICKWGEAWRTGKQIVMGMLLIIAYWESKSLFLIPVCLFIPLSVSLTFIPLPFQSNFTITQIFFFLLFSKSEESSLPPFNPWTIWVPKDYSLLIWPPLPKQLQL